MSPRLKWILPLVVLAAGVALAGGIFASRPRVEAQPAEAAAPLVRVVEARVEPVRLEDRLTRIHMTSNEESLRLAQAP